MIKITKPITPCVFTCAYGVLGFEAIMMFTDVGNIYPKLKRTLSESLRNISQNGKQEIITLNNLKIAFSLITTLIAIRGAIFLCIKPLSFPAAIAFTSLSTYKALCEIDNLLFKANHQQAIGINVSNLLLFAARTYTATQIYNLYSNSGNIMPLILAMNTFTAPSFASVSNDYHAPPPRKPFKLLQPALTAIAAPPPVIASEAKQSRNSVQLAP